ncbi:MAG TPA: sigma-70 family RNA polymerase sigma factor [Planctomycetota bacterium]
MHPLPTLTPPAPHPGIERYRVGLWRFLRMLGASATEADDLAQETLLVGVQHALAGDDRDRAFLRGVARNQWLRTRRWWQKRREREVAAAVEELWSAAEADDGEEMLGRLRACLQQLQQRARQALLLHYGDGLGWSAVAAQIGLKPNGTKTLVQRARQALRTCIERRH